MALRIDIRSLVLGLAVGVVVLLALGARGDGGGTGKYQVAIAAGTKGVFYVKVNTETGKMETWRMSPVEIQKRRRLPAKAKRK